MRESGWISLSVATLAAGLLGLHTARAVQAGIQITGANGQPYEGAIITLDDGQSATTDKDGMAMFPDAPDTWGGRVRTQDYLSQDIDYSRVMDHIARTRIWGPDSSYLDAPKVGDLTIGLSYRMDSDYGADFIRGFNSFSSPFEMFGGPIPSADIDLETSAAVAEMVVGVYGGTWGRTRFELSPSVAAGFGAVNIITRESPPNPDIKFDGKGLAYGYGLNLRLEDRFQESPWSYTLRYRSTFLDEVDMGHNSPFFSSFKGDGSYHARNLSVLGTYHLGRTCTRLSDPFHIAAGYDIRSIEADLDFRTHFRDAGGALFTGPGGVPVVRSTRKEVEVDCEMRLISQFGFPVPGGNLGCLEFQYGGSDDWLVGVKVGRWFPLF